MTAQLLTRAMRPTGPDAPDLYLNDRTYWRNVPRAAWNYTLGGYQVLKKWLSHRATDLLANAARRS